MRKYVLLTLLTFFPCAAHAATEAYSTFITNTTTVGGTVPTSGLIAVTTGGHTYSAQASQFGGSPPGAQGNIPVNGGAGLYAAQNDFYAAGYGAVCDGGIIPMGITTTTGSPNIGLIGTLSFPEQWGLAAGDTIVLSNPSQINTGVNPTTNQILSVVSATSTTAVLSGNVTFTSASYQYASARYYKTVNTTALQNSINAAYATGQGGKVVLPTGGCATANLTYPYPGVSLFGAGPQTSILILANNSNSDLLTGYQFSLLTGTGDSGGSTGWVMEDLGLDGNKGANTGTNIGQPTGTGDLLRFYGADFYWNRVGFSNAASDAIYSEWNSGAGDPLNSQFSLNARPEHLQFVNNNGWAWVYNGPHDGHISNIDITNCGAGGIIQYGFNELITNANGGPLSIDSLHSYQCSGTGFDLSLGSSTAVTNSQPEGTVLLRNFDFPLVNNDIGTLQLGATTTSSVTYAIEAVNNRINTVVNNSGTGFNDSWTGGYIGTLTQNSVYNPWFAFGVQHGYHTSNGPFFNGVSLDPNAAESVQVLRPCCGNKINGQNLTLSAGGGYLAEGNKNGGNLILSSGLSTGSGTSQIVFNVFAATTSGTTDNAATQAMTLSSTGNLGIGPTSPTDRLDVSGGLGLTATSAVVPTNGQYLPAVNTLSLTTSGATRISVNNVGHEILAGTAPSVLTGCGTASTAVGTDNSGAVTMGTTPSGSCVVTFANSWTNPPDGCECTDNTTSSQGCRALGISTTSVALSATTTPFTAADKVSYRCYSHQF